MTWLRGPAPGWVDADGRVSSFEEPLIKVAYFRAVNKDQAIPSWASRRLSTLSESKCSSASARAARACRG